MNFLRITPGGNPDARGLRAFRLGLWQAGAEVDHLVVVSGAPGAQALRVAAASISGSCEPIPEGLYALGDSDAVHGLNWRQGQGSYEGTWGEGLGPVWCGIWPDVGVRTTRERLGIHLDENAKRSPGTAGCVGVTSMEDLHKLAGWFADAGWPRMLVVDYGLASIPALPSLLERLGQAVTRVVARLKRQWWKLYRRPDAMRAFRGEKEITSGLLEIDFSPGRLNVKVNGQQIKARHVTVEIEEEAA